MPVSIFRRISIGVLVLPVAISLQVAAPAPVQANPLFGGIAGGLLGAGIGGILGGSGGAGAGAVLGGITGAIAGANANADERRKREAARLRAIRLPIAPPVIVVPSALVLSIQQSLIRLGYNPGSIDGRFGPATASAIRSYQQQNGLAVTGQPSQALARHMLRSGSAPTASTSALWSVTGVASDDVLNVRSAPSGGAPVVGALSPYAGGIERLGCLTPADSSTEWCRIRRGSTEGWVAARFLMPQPVALPQ